MKLLQVTNIVSHHQLPIARQFVKLLGENNFRFAALAPPDIGRLRLGWACNDPEPWILRPGEIHSDRLKFERWWVEADVVLCGERLFNLFADRISRQKLCFYMSERWWKPPIGIFRMLSFKYLKMFFQLKCLANSDLFHYLPIGPIASNDIGRIAKFREREWSWGYFSAPSSIFSLTHHASPLKVLWVGRMLDWKRLDTLIYALSDASKAGLDFKLTIVGEGPERATIEKLARLKLKSHEYDLFDSLPAAEIMGVMRAHDVYVLPSSAYEGWGVVINEAMSCGCAIVASKDTGAAAAMVEDNVNGLLFNPGDWRDLSLKIQRLGRDDALRFRLATAAFHTVQDFWSPQCAAERFVAVSEALLDYRCTPSYQAGPMSRPSLRQTSPGFRF